MKKIQINEITTIVVDKYLAIQQKCMPEDKHYCDEILILNKADARKIREIICDFLIKDITK